MATRMAIDKLLYVDEPTAGGLYTGEHRLMGTWEVARYLGIERSRIARWLDENAQGKQSIESPVARLKSGPFWTLEQVERKARQMYEADGRSSPSKAELERWLQARRARRERRPEHVAA